MTYSLKDNRVARLKILLQLACLIAEVIALSYAVPTSFAGDGFLIRGEIETTQYFSNTEVIRRPGKFVAIVDGCRYLIQSQTDGAPITLPVTSVAVGSSITDRTSPQPVSSAGVNKYEWSFDGEDTYDAKGTDVSWLTMVYHGERLGSSLTFHQVLWLAFASGCRLAELTNAVLEPIWPVADPKREVDGFHMTVHFEMLKDPPALLRRLVYLGDGFYHGYDPVRGAFMEPLPKPYSKGFTNAEYTVLSVTNCLAGSIPQHALFIRYLVPRANPGQLQPIERTEVRVQQVRTPSGDVAYIPSFRDHTDVIDYRLKGTVQVVGVSDIPYDYLRYGISNRSWPSKAQLADLRIAYEATIRGRFVKQEQAVKIIAQNKRRVALTRIVLLASILIGFTLLVRSVVLQHNKNKNDKGQNE